MIGDRIREARTACKMTQSELASQISVAKSTLSGYEIGNSEPDVLRIQAICKVLHVDANFLLQDEMSISVQRNSLTNRELRVACEYHSLDSHGKRMIDLVLKEEAARMAATHSTMEEQAEIARERYGGASVTDALPEAE